MEEGNDGGLCTSIIVANNLLFGDKRSATLRSITMNDEGGGGTGDGKSQLRAGRRC